MYIFKNKFYFFSKYFFKITMLSHFVAVVFDFDCMNQAFSYRIDAI